MKIGTSTVTAIYLGTTSITSAYLGATQVFGGSFTPLSLFSGGAQGIWLDPSDLSTMFSDRAGTTAVTTPGTVVGLRLDKSKGLTLGAELVANGTFDSGITSWTSGLGTPALSWVPAGAMRVTRSATAGFNVASQSISGLVVGKTYVVTALFSSVAVGLTPSVAINFVATGTDRLVFKATATSHTLEIVTSSGSTGQSFDVDNISVRELPGNHATAPTDAARPTYGVEPKGGRRNLLTRSEDFGNAAWNVSGITYSSAAGFDGVSKNALATVGNVGNRIRTNGNTVLPNTQYTFSFYAKLGTATGNRYGVFDVTNATLFVANVIYDSLLNSSTYTRVSVTFTTPAGCTQIYPYLMNGTTTTGTVFLDGAQLEAGTLSAYQRVTTDYDVTEAGVQTCHYCRYDGSNSSMSTAAIDFTGTDKMSVFAGVRKLSDAAIQLFYELSANVNTNNGTFNSLPGYSGIGSLVGAYWNGGSKGSVLANAVSAATFSAPSSAVQSHLMDISGDRSTLRINGAQVAQETTDQGTGNFGNYPLFIGRRGNSALPFSGKDYGIIVVGKAASGTEITDTETWLAARTAQVTL